MEQFSLEKYLENPSREILTRDGRPVRIVCWDVKGLFPILALIEGNGERDTKVGEEYPCCYKVDGTCPVSDSYDLFFADEEEELTEFEKAIYQYICTIVTVCDGKVYGDKELKPIVKGIAKDLLDLARKELLKDLPKWKKSTLPIPDEEYPTGFNCKYFCYKGYCIDYKKLFETLPKEE